MDPPAAPVLCLGRPWASGKKGCREEDEDDEGEEEERIHSSAGPVGDAEAQQEEGAQGEQQRRHDVTDGPARGWLNPN